MTFKVSSGIIQAKLSVMMKQLRNKGRTVERENNIAQRLFFEGIGPWRAVVP